MISTLLDASLPVLFHRWYAKALILVHDVHSSIYLAYLNIFRKLVREALVTKVVLLMRTHEGWHVVDACNIMDCAVERMIMSFYN